MLSEPCFRDHFNKEMLTKLSPTLISVVARKKMGHVVEKIPFYAHTVQRTGGYPKGCRVMVHEREWEHAEEPSVGRPALVLRSPSLLRYDVQFDDGEIQKNVRHTHVEPPPLCRRICYILDGARSSASTSSGTCFSRRSLVIHYSTIHDVRRHRPQGPQLK